MSLLDKVTINPDFITGISCIGTAFELGMTGEKTTIVGYYSTGDEV